MNLETITCFRRQTIAEKLARLWPPEKRRQDARLKEELRRLVQNPAEPCFVDNVWVPSGYSQGGNT